MFMTDKSSWVEFHEAADMKHVPPNHFLPRLQAPRIPIKVGLIIKENAGAGEEMLDW